MATLIVALIVFPVAIAILIYSVVARKKRREAFRAVAEGLGWTYTERDPELVAPYRQLPLFRDGHAAENVLRGEFGPRRATVFEYTEGSGKSAMTHTVVHLQGEADLPVIELRPEIRFADTIFKSFGYQDIEISHRPEFARAFVLRGPDEEAIRARFSDAVVDAVESIPGFCVQASGQDLFLYRMSVVVMPDALPELLTAASNLLRTFEEELDASSRAMSPPPLPA